MTFTDEERKRFASIIAQYEHLSADQLEAERIHLVKRREESQRDTTYMQDHGGSQDAYFRAADDQNLIGNQLFVVGTLLKQRR